VALLCHIAQPWCAKSHILSGRHAAAQSKVTDGPEGRQREFHTRAFRHLQQNSPARRSIVGCADSAEDVVPGAVRTRRAKLEEMSSRGGAAIPDNAVREGNAM